MSMHAGPGDSCIVAHIYIPHSTTHTHAQYAHMYILLKYVSGTFIFHVTNHHYDNSLMIV